MAETTARHDAADRPQLTRAGVADRAVALADADGLDAVTVRRLARELGVTPMALYWHFRRKDELLEALVDRVVAEVDLAVDPAASWREQFAALMRSIVRVLRAHPWVSGLLAGRDRPPDGYLGALEVMLDVLRRGGFQPEQATTIVRHSLSTATGLVDAEPAHAPQLSTGERAEMARRSRVLLETLPNDRYPRIVEAAAPLSTCDDPDGYYEFGLDLLLAGIDAMAPDSDWRLPRTGT